MKKYSIPALEKAIAILDLIASSEKEYSLSDICKKLSIPKSTVYTTLNVLESYNFLKKNEHGSYRIGSKLHELGMLYISKIDITKIARPYLKELMLETGLTVHLGMLDQSEMLYIDKVEPDTFIKFSTYPGLRSPIHTSSLGKAISAFMNLEELDEIISQKGLGKYTSKTITDPLKFKEHLEIIRDKGYAVEDEEGEIGVRCIGAPIFNNSSNQVTVSVSVVGHKSELISDIIPLIAKNVMKTAEDISKKVKSLS